MSFDWKVVAAGDDPRSAAFWSSGVTTATLSSSTTVYDIAASPGVTYAARVRVADASTNPTNVFTAEAAYVSPSDLS